MAENDGEVRIATTLDTQDLQKQLDQLKGKLDKTGKDIEKKGTGFKKLGDFIKSGGVAAAVGGTAAAVAIKKTVDALDDCAEAYRVQEKAEKALAIAAKNNPYLNDENVENLRRFASELQNMSEVGDEVSLQVMSQLAATGRTESEIIQIMSAAADMAAATEQDIGSVAQQLNATFSGNTGALGRQISELKNLTQAELEAGKAVEIIAGKYKGSAAELATVEVQLSNSWGDFKENIGRGWQTVTAPVKKFFLDVLNDINEANAKTKELKDARLADANGTGTAASTKILLDEELKKLDALAVRAARARVLIASTDKEIRKSEEYLDFTLWSGSFNPLEDFKKLQQQIIDDTEKQKKRVSELKTEYADLTKEEKAAQEAAAAAAAAEKNAEELRKRDEDATKYINENKKALEEQIKTLKLKAKVTGEDIDAGELYNAYLNSYIELVTKSNGLVSENNSAAKERLKLLLEQAEALKAQNEQQERDNKAQADAEERKRNAEKIRDTALDLIRDEAAERLQLIKDIDENELLSRKEKNKAIEKLDAEAAEKRRQSLVAILDESKNYTNQINNIIADATALALQTEENRMKAELDNLEIKYRKGELGEEEYQAKVAEAKKKGARIQYQIEMSQWASNILTATANTAVGVTQALAQGGVAGIITGALVGAAGAVQLASIMAAKPIQHFATGGFVGGMRGASLGGDNTTIAARSGELVVNAAQQRELWDMINGRGAGGNGGVNLVVNNSASNIVSTSAQIDRNKIELMIDARVNEGLKKGRFNAGLNAANSSMSGEYYGL